MTITIIITNKLHLLGLRIIIQFNNKGAGKVRICTAHAVSIGTFCQSAVFIRNQMSKECKSKRHLLPFDVVYSNPEMVVDCIRNRFNVFLNRQLIYGKVNKSGHVIYDRLNQEFHNWRSEGKSHCTFHHHDLTRDELHYKYAEGCEKFLALSNVPHTKLFVCTTNPDSRRLTVKSRTDLAKEISEMFPDSHVLLVDIRVEKQLPRKCTTVREIVETVTVTHILR